MRVLFEVSHDLILASLSHPFGYLQLQCLLRSCSGQSVRVVRAMEKGKGKGKGKAMALAWQLDVLGQGKGARPRSFSRSRSRSVSSTETTISQASTIPSSFLLVPHRRIEPPDPHRRLDFDSCTPPDRVKGRGKGNAKPSKGTLTS